MAKENPSVNIDTFVDYTVVYSQGDEQFVCDSIMDAMVYFKGMVKRLSLRMSPKGVVAASSKKMMRQLRLELASQGIIMQHSEIVRDLGAGFGSGSRNTSKHVRNRFRRTSIVRRKAKQLSQIARSARKLFSGSAFSSSTYGHPLSGVSPSLNRALEVDAAKCTGITPQGRCRFTAISIGFGPRGHPYARIIRETLSLWFQIIRHFHKHALLDTLRDSWTKAKTAMLQYFSRPDTQEFSAFKQIKGLVSNVIFILLSCGWSPRTFNVWDDPEKDTWRMVIGPKTRADNLVIYALVDSYNSIQCARADNHYNGRGIAKGIDWNNTLRLLLSLKRQAKYNILSALETVIAGASWPNARVASIHPNVSPLCEYCGAVSDALHDFWTCPRHSMDQDDVIVKSQQLVPKAEAGCQDFPCLWLRGIFPMGLTELKPEHQPLEQTCHVLRGPRKPEGEGSWPSATYFGDALEVSIRRMQS